MSELRVNVEWQHAGGPFTYDGYDRTHRWSVPGGTPVVASAAPEYFGRAELPNPEQALAAAASSCHMLAFLALAARKRFSVASYRDEASAWLDKNAEGRLAVTRIVLRPKVEFSGEPPSDEALQRLHDQAHHHCFIANSLRSEVVLERR